MMTNLFIGFDAGATKTSVAFSSDADGSAVTHRRLPGANIRHQDPAAVATALIDGLQDLWSNDVDQVVMVGGIAGGLARDRLNELARLFEVAARVRGNAGVIRLMSDVELAATMAHGTAAGILIVCGTGTVGVVRDGEDDFRVRGGWGYLLGDEGGGQRLGIALLRHVAKVIDSQSEDEIANEFYRRYPVKDRHDLLDLAYAEKNASVFAPLLLEFVEREVTGARTILDSELGPLAELISSLVFDHPGLPVAVMGGLTRSSAYITALDAMVPEVNLASCVLDGDPAATALAIARESANG